MAHQSALWGSFYKEQSSSKNPSNYATYPMAQLKVLKITLSTILYVVYKLIYTK